MFEWIKYVFDYDFEQNAQAIPVSLEPVQVNIRDPERKAKLSVALLMFGCINSQGIEKGSGASLYISQVDGELYSASKTSSFCDVEILNLDRKFYLPTLAASH